MPENQIPTSLTKLVEILVSGQSAVGLEEAIAKWQNELPAAIRALTGMNLVGLGDYLRHLTNPEQGPITPDGQASSQLIQGLRQEFAATDEVLAAFEAEQAAGQFSDEAQLTELTPEALERLSKLVNFYGDSPQA